MTFGRWSVNLIFLVVGRFDSGRFRFLEGAAFFFLLFCFGSILSSKIVTLF